MERVWRYPSGPAAVIIVGFVLTFFAAAGGVWLLGTSSPDALGAVFVTPVIFVMTLPMLFRQAARENDHRLLWLLVAALVIKIIGAFVRHYVVYDVYSGVGDATGYHGAGLELSERFRDGNFDTGLDSLSGTDFISFFTGALYTVIGPTRLGGFVFFSWLGFIGLFYFYRAFVEAVPAGRSRTYACLLFFFPTLVFWPSSIGKEAWMIFALGIGAFGIAKMMSGRTFNGLAIAAVGLWMAGLVRGHMAGMLALAMAAAFLLRKPRSELRQLVPVARAITLVIVLGVAGVVASQASTFLDDRGIRFDSGLEAALQTASGRSDQGGSEFEPATIDSPVKIPLAAATVLFRPFPFEANNAQAGITALEGSFLIALIIARRRWIWSALTSVRRNPYIAVAIVYTSLFVIAFSSVANFGLLARQRAQLLPLLLVLLSVPPVRNTEEKALAEENLTAPLHMASVAGQAEEKVS